MNSKQPTTPTTRCKSLIFSIDSVVGMHFLNLPHRLPQPTTRIWVSAKKAVKILCNNNLQPCGVW